MSKSALLLTDLPAELKEKIANVSDYRSKMSLRQVTEDFKKAVDNSEFFYDSLVFKWKSNEKTISIHLNVDRYIKKEVKFRDISNEFKVENQKENWQKTVKSSTVNYIDAAIEHFWKILKHRNRSMIHIKLVSLCLEGDYVQDECFHNSMRQFNEKLRPDPTNKTKLSVRKLELKWVSDPESYLNVISLVKPGILKTLNVVPMPPVSAPFSNPSYYDFDFTRIAETDHWKQLNFLDSWVCHVMPPSLDTSHFAELRCKKSSKMTLQEIKELIEEMFLHPAWKSRVLTCSFDDNVSRNDFFEGGFTGSKVIRRGQDACQFIINHNSVSIKRLKALTPT